MTRRFIVDLIDSDETDRFVGKYGADEITNMTNGDVIKALFPNLTIEFNGHIFMDVSMGDGCMLQSVHSWWNTPYKKE